MKRYSLFLLVFLIVSLFLPLYISEVEATPDLIDSYPEENYTGDQFAVRDHHPSDSSDTSALAQSFTGQAKKITSCKWRLHKTGSPTGNAHAVLYAHSGTFGTSSKPTGSALGTSDDFDVTQLDGTNQLYEFTFSGAEQYLMSAATYYCITFENPASGTIDGDNYVRIAKDSDAAGGHAGNEARFRSAAWVNDADNDMIFYVYGEAVGEERNFYGEINPQFTITHLNSWTFNRYGTVNPTFTITSLVDASVIKNFFGEVTQILFEFSFPAHEITWSFNRFGQIAQTWLINHVKSWSFDLHGFINPLFTVESFAEFIAGAIENFYGEIITQFTITTVKTVAFSLNPIVDLLVSVNGVFTVPNLINIYAFINLAFTILGYSPIAAPITINDVVALAAIGFIIAIVALAVAFTKRD